MMNIALVAHDNKKKLMQNLCIAYRAILAKHTLLATETTGRLIEKVTNLNINKCLPGHLGGELQISAQIIQNDIDLVIFLRDPVSSKKYEIDSNNILELCDIHNIPLASNLATSEALLLGVDRGDFSWRNILK